ncbi:phage protein NinX family protein [Paraburkholderia dioscoreae]|uniref:phage protein NinX family protein n=1 Tax=Paraburkholderia dioscoreae TaxID=2604047 RepID=UPI0013EB9FF6|nr:phage protein NinX family protein [Paraburkholderia dioscoreae]
MKTKKLEGAVLDYWVSRALKTPIDQSKRFDPVSTDAPRHHDPRDFPDGSGSGAVPPYSTDWGIAGGVIDRMCAGRNGICLTGSVDDGFQANHAAGAAPLVALMRSFVFSVFGSEVPDRPVQPPLIPKSIDADCANYQSQATK